MAISRRSIDDVHQNTMLMCTSSTTHHATLPCTSPARNARLNTLPTRAADSYSRSYSTTAPTPTSAALCTTSRLLSSLAAVDELRGERRHLRCGAL